MGYDPDAELVGIGIFLAPNRSGEKKEEYLHFLVLVEAYVTNHFCILFIGRPIYDNKNSARWASVPNTANTSG
jgi:hypothetical protein